MGKGSTAEAMRKCDRIDNLEQTILVGEKSIRSPQVEQRLEVSRGKSVGGRVDELMKWKLAKPLDRGRM